ncbi:MAG: hypothetical protein PHG85_03015 [Candidatus Altiarchaeota archaeon]|nr:hypothetical protein [Candidatus Altiarchaeota archaeon]
MGAYTKLKPDARAVVDAVYAGTTEKEIKAAGLPGPMELDSRLKILFPGKPDVQQGIREDYRLHVAVKRLGQSLDSVQIGEKIGRSDSIVREWLRGSKPGDFSKLSDIDEYRIPTEKSVEFATFLGFVFSVRGKQGKKGALEFGSTDARLLNEFNNSVRALWGRESHDLKDEEGRIKGKFVSSKEARNYVDIITNNWTTLPWEHLVTKDERQAFLRAWLSNSSSISRAQERGGAKRRLSVVDVSKKADGDNDPRLGILRDLRILLLDLGFGNTFVRQNQDRYTVRISDLDDLQKLADEKLFDGTTGYFIQPERRDRLREVVGESRNVSRAYSTRHEYYLARRLMGGGMSVDEVAEKFGLHAETARKWGKGLQKPAPVRWDEEVGTLKAARKPDEIGYAFRHITKEPGEARMLAEKNGMNELEAIKTREETGRFLWDAGLPLFPGEYWPLTRTGLDDARLFINGKRQELVKRTVAIMDRLMHADWQAVQKVIGELPNNDVYERSLRHARSNEPAAPFTTVSLERIALAIARKPQLVEEIHTAPLPGH